MSNNTELQTALRSSHRRLEEATRPLTDEEIAGPSYCTDWSTAQVLSHIGSGAQVFGLLLDAGLAGAEQPGREEFSRIWDVWNAMSSDRAGAQQPHRRRGVPGPRCGNPRRSARRHADDAVRRPSGCGPFAGDAPVRARDPHLGRHRHPRPGCGGRRRRRRLDGRLARPRRTSLGEHAGWTARGRHHDHRPRASIPALGVGHGEAPSCRRRHCRPRRPRCGCPRQPWSGSSTAGWTRSTRPRPWRPTGSTSRR